MKLYKNFCPATVEVDGYQVACKSATYESHTHRGSFVDDGVKYNVEWFDHNDSILKKED